jgi:hypothetical protein
MSEPIISDGRVDTCQAVAASAHCMLGPGERVINGRVCYSAVWLGAQPEVVPEAACDRLLPAQSCSDGGRDDA